MDPGRLEGTNEGTEPSLRLARAELSAAWARCSSSAGRGYAIVAVEPAGAAVLVGQRREPGVGINTRALAESVVQVPPTEAPRSNQQPAGSQRQ